MLKTTPSGRQFGNAIEKNIPIIAVNLNKKKERDDERCPPLLKNELAIHIPFGQRIMDYALNNWEASHHKRKANKESGAYHYNQSVYDKFE